MTNDESAKQFDKHINFYLIGEAITTFNEIQQFLFGFHNLTHLTLHIRGSADQLANGNYWETCSTIIRLRKFDFIFEFEHPFVDSTRDISQIFNSFSTSFWRDSKKWYVAVTTHNIYTISYFNEQLYIPSTSLLLSTSPSDHWFYSKVKRIKIEKNISSINLNHFYNLETLDLSEESIILSIRNINQFTHLRHLIIHQAVSNAILGNILTHNPHINHLTLSQNDFKQLIPLENIHCLHLQDSIKITSRTQMTALCRVFPSVKRVFVDLNSVQLLSQIIDDLHHLENGIFHFDKIIKPISQEWLKENTRLDDNTSSFTYRNEPNRFLLWINNSVSTKSIANNSYNF